MALLVLGTGNRKKGIELAGLVAPLGLEVKTLADFPEAIEVVEDGATFAENARLKAARQAIHLGRWVLADDSGLSVDALKGAPGVFSARYSDPGATDARNNTKLLQALQGIPVERRTARFVCHVALADPTGKLRTESHADCRGRIIPELRGGQGFGYDPLFEIVEYHRTFGELGLTVKAFLSHRARAMRQILPEIQRLIAIGEWV
ncbi:MAG: RdgB/HAM1 family non-canonical purine NTP pyrophosphatase [Planctomycetia bacterium]|nr:RdgB/HAM1 family non-canonical purine NTP pyrophosphatase [Planctomycetia bacterium]